MHFLFGTPIEPVRTMRLSARFIELPKGRKGIFIMPFQSSCFVKIAVGLIDIERRVKGEIQIQQPFHHGIPLFRTLFGSLFPEFSGFFKAVLLIGIIIIERIILYGIFLKQCLRKTIPMFHAGQPCFCRVHHIPPGYIHLGMVHARAKAQLFIFSQSCIHDGWSSPKELDAIGPFFSIFPDPVYRQLRS